ncbi:MAG: hypothetical protein GDA50_03545 [Alphaproteobacteria bacterium GM202ARS2]|nr:hypothetical protein [Alphaproteobacteria bacterium GM202ARS2]
MLSRVSFLKDFVGRLGSGVARAAPSINFGEDINAAVRRDMASDFWAMADDWQTVGKDMNRAIEEVVVVDTKTQPTIIDKDNERVVVRVDAETLLDIIEQAKGYTTIGIIDRDTKKIIARADIKTLLKSIDTDAVRALLKPKRRRKNGSK